MTTILHGGVPMVLPARWRQSPAYRRYRAEIARATTFPDAVRYLAEILADPERRLFAAADFAPQAAYARKFLNSAALARRGSEDQQFTAIQAQQVLTRLLIATAGGQTHTASPDRRAVPARVFEWTRVILMHWPKAFMVLQDLEYGNPWLVPHREALTTLLTRKAKRPVHVAHQIVAWEQAISVRAVRAACRTRRPVILKSA